MNVASLIVWTIARGQQRFGPYTKDKLEHLAAAGRLTANDLAWNPKLDHWVSATDILPGKIAPPLSEISQMRLFPHFPVEIASSHRELKWSRGTPMLDGRNLLHNNQLGRKNLH